MFASAVVNIVNVPSLNGISASAVPRVFLADDQPAMRQTIAQLLAAEFNVVGTAENGQCALELVRTLSPDIVILDIGMPVLDGIGAAKHLRDSGCAARVIFLTVESDPDFVDAACSAGAFGYVLKSCAAADLVPAIHEALQGRLFISPSITALC